MDASVFQKRIGYKGDLKVFLQKVIGDYKLGSIKSSRPILQGYEDFNVRVETNKGKYLVKMMGTFRSDNEAEQYADIIQKAVDGGVCHPKLYRSPQGNLYKSNLNGTEVRLVVMDFIEGRDFQEKDMVVIKKRYSGFFKTNLEETLKSLSTDLLIVCGVNSHACVRTTVIDAYQRDYEVVIAKDCVASYDPEHHAVSMKYFTPTIAQVKSNEEIIKLLE